MIIEKPSLSVMNNDSEAPLISIILVCLDSEKTIEQTIQSIINLDYPNIEFIVIDGDSHDGTKDILNRYSRFIDKIVIEKDNGIYDAMNKGVKLAKGDFLYFIGSDDIVINSWSNLKGKLKPGNTVYYGNVYFPVTNHIYDGKFGFLRLLNRNICHQAIFYPKAVFEKYQYTNEYPLVADYYLNLLINSDPGFKFKFIDILIAVFSEKGISNNLHDFKFREDHIKIIRKNYSMVFCLYIYIVKIFEKMKAFIKGK
jgi:glycosyltransferase involved in cell wall biosynthesis